jgi:integrase
MNFTQAATSFIRDLSKPRRAGVLAMNTQRIYRAYANKAAAVLGDVDLSEVRNGRVKAFVETLRAGGLADSTIVGHLTTLQLIVASVKTADGEKVYPQEFDSEFCAIPIVRAENQYTPAATAVNVEAAIAAGNILIPFLAASGLRISEALSLTGMPGIPVEQANYYDADSGVIHILKGKTPAAKRDVYLQAVFNEWFRDRVSAPAGGAHLFDLNYQQVRQQLDAQSLPMPHSYRRLYATHARKHRMAESVLKYLMGHSKGSDITSRYDQSCGDVEFVRAEVERVGLSFSL